MENIGNANDLVKRLVSLGNVAIYLIVSLAIIFIVWNVVMWLIRGGNPDEKKKAVGNIGWGILGLAIIASIWGIVNILTGTFFKDAAGAPRDRFPSADFVSYPNNEYGPN